MQKLTSPLLVVCVLAAAWIAAPDVAARELTFEQRVLAQQAIEQVYHSYRIGTRRSFDEAVPRAVIESRVRDYLARSALLERDWNRPVTAAMLEAELRRMARATRMPERLRALFAALDDDPFLIQECLARPVLVDRLTRSFFAHDDRVHDTERDWDVWWQSTRAGLDASRVRAVASLYVELPPVGVTPSHPLTDAAADVPCLPDDTWDNGSFGDLSDPRTHHVAVWTGSEMIVWGGSSATTYSATGRRYDPATGTWTPMSMQNAPSGRVWFSGIWTGSEMIVWGGWGGQANGYFNTGGRYDPLTDTWTPTSTVNAPEARGWHTLVWTGDKMIAWGGSPLSTTGLNTGGIYDPETDTWDGMAIPVLAPRTGHSAVWVGDGMVVWGGHNGQGNFLDGAKYLPSLNTWTSISTIQAPAARARHRAVWTGDEMIVWGGQDYDSMFNSGGRYDPETNSWTPTSLADAPEARYEHTTIWTGDEMIVWGGTGQSTGPLDSGGRYDPTTNTWSPTATVNDPSQRRRHSAVWTGDAMIVWGGWSGVTAYNTGGRYDPAADSWTPTSTLGAPQARLSHSAIWTGNWMIVWGGYTDVVQPLGTGGRYDPVLDVWQSMSSVDAPEARWSHTAVWTGDEMIVWGGDNGDDDPHLASGGRYDPATDSWQATSLEDAPHRRTNHTAVWTGTEMIVWGGFGYPDVPYDDAYQNTGGRYDPATDSWTPTNSTQFFTPRGRAQHTAVWTGSEMIVWGGRGGLPDFPLLTSGARYDPATDDWSLMTGTGSPSVREQHTAVWTGSEMIVWGGRSGNAALSTGGRYDPSADSWQSTTVSGAPDKRFNHAVVWTGNEMIVWGGQGINESHDTGGRYDPLSNLWNPTSMSGAPMTRFAHTGVWTGSSMLIWGGIAPGAYFNNGGRYVFGHGSDDDGDGLSECGGDCNDGNPLVLPGAPEVCDLLDNDCSGIADDLDFDGDGFFACSADCNDADAGVHAIPEEVAEVSFGADGTTLSWSSAAPGAGEATVHDVVRATVAELPVGSGAELCLAAGVGGTSASDQAVPAPDSGYWYLVRGRNSCGDGPYGSASDGETRVTTACP